MPIAECRSCRKKYRVPESGKKYRCKSCGGVVQEQLGEGEAGPEEPSAEVPSDRGGLSVEPRAREKSSRRVQPGARQPGKRTGLRKRAKGRRSGLSVQSVGRRSRKKQVRSGRLLLLAGLAAVAAVLTLLVFFVLMAPSSLDSAARRFAETWNGTGGSEDEENIKALAAFFPEERREEASETLQARFSRYGWFAEKPNLGDRSIEESGESRCTVTFALRADDRDLDQRVEWTRNSSDEWQVTDIAAIPELHTLPFVARLFVKTWNNAGSGSEAIRLAGKIACPDDPGSMQALLGELFMEEGWQRKHPKLGSPKIVRNSFRSDVPTCVEFPLEEAMASLPLSTFWIPDGTSWCCRRVSLWSTDEAAAEAPFLRHIPGDHVNLAVLNDPLDPLVRFYSDAAVQDLLSESYGGALQENLEPLKRFKPFVPCRVVAAAPPSLWDTLDAWGRAILHVVFYVGAIEDPIAIEEDDLLELREAALEAAGRLEIPRFTIWVDMRDDTGLDTVMLLVTSRAAQLLRGTEVDATINRSQVLVSATLTEIFGGIESFSQLIGLDDPGFAENPMTAIVEKLGQLRVDLRLERIGSGIRLQVGPGSGPDARTLAASQLGPDFHTGPSEIFFARWDITRLKALAAGWSQLGDKGENPAAAAYMKQLDPEDLLGDLMRDAETLQLLADKGAVRLWMEEGALCWVLREEGVAEAPAVADTKILNMIPAECELFAADSYRPVSNWFEKALSRAEGQLSNEALTNSLLGNEEAAQESDSKIEAYYSHMDKLRDLVFNGSVDIFQPPSAWLAMAEDRIDRLEVKTESEGQGSILRYYAEDVRIPEIACIGRVKSRDASVKYNDKLAHAVVTGLFSIAGRRPAIDGSLIREIDLGLGGQTFAFRGEWIKGPWPTVEMTAGFPGRAMISIEADAPVHFFYLDDYVVFSTSRKLSTKIVAAYRGKSTRKEIFSPDSGRLVGMTLLSGKEMASLMDCFPELFENLHVSLESETGRITELAVPRGKTPTAQSFELLSGLCRLMESAHWITVEQGGNRSTRGWVQRAR